MRVEFVLPFSVGMARAGVSWSWVLCLAALGPFLAGACQNTEAAPPPLADRLAPTRTETGEAGTQNRINLPPQTTGGKPATAPEGTVPCGGERISARLELPNLYFVIDASGSMADPFDGSGASKLTGARRSIGNLLRAMGHRFRYGAMLFPASPRSSDCAPGREIFALADGDPLGGQDPGENGPVLQVLLNRLAGRSAGGPTPTAATLAEARTHLSQQPGASHLVLVTDGAPNCNLELSDCPTEQCIPDIERASLDDDRHLICGRDLSCCDPSVAGDLAGAHCIDEAATLAAVEALLEASIPTYVIGMPGSAQYRDLLQRMASAGATARAGETAYYAVSDEPELLQALFEIGTFIPIGCDLVLQEAPEDRELVNVYFDRDPILRDPVDGWEWTGAELLRLHGQACQTLESGGVAEVEVVYGCQTLVR